VLLEDYGFSCSCSRCNAEKEGREEVAQSKLLAAEAKRTGTVGGSKRKQELASPVRLDTQPAGAGAGAAGGEGKRQRQ
jgi:hypothetical protein